MSDALDVSLNDPEQIVEIDLVAELMVAALEAPDPGPLPQTTIDHILLHLPTCQNIGQTRRVCAR